MPALLSLLSRLASYASEALSRIYIKIRFAASCIFVKINGSAEVLIDSHGKAIKPLVPANSVRSLVCKHVQRQLRSLSVEAYKGSSLVESWYQFVLAAFQMFLVPRSVDTTCQTVGATSTGKKRDIRRVLG